MKPTPLAAFHQALARLLATWLTLMLLQSLGRVVFFFSFLPSDYSQQTSLGSSLSIFLLGLRLDASVASLGLLPSFLAALVLVKWPQWLPGWVLKFRWVQGLLLVLVLLMQPLKHYYYYFYQDSFSVFFWEFWLSLENARMVVYALPTEIPLFGCILYILALSALAFWLPRTLTRPLGAWLSRPALQRKTLVAVWLLLALQGSRGTFDSLPLHLQHYRARVSSNQHEHFTHSNGFYNLYTSWDSSLHQAQEIKAQVGNPAMAAKVQGWLAELAQENPRTRPVLDQGKWALEYRKPKHVVVLMMESYNLWPSEYTEGGFNQQVAPTQIWLKEHSVWFENYVKAGPGTIGNLGKVLLVLPTPVDAPLETAFAESFRPFPHDLPLALKGQGYEPVFFYGGNLAWHNLGKFAQAIGFEKVYSEADSASKEKTRFGVHDGDLFALIDQRLSQATKPTLAFVMTLTNHPPYQVPADYVSPLTGIPPGLKPFLKSEENFQERFRAFAYADRELGRFLEMAKAHGYYNDTLFLITGDHAMLTAVRWPLERQFASLKIPLLVHAPALLKLPPQRLHNLGTHYDLLPTLLSLVADEEFPIHSWGSSLFLPKPNRLDSFDLVCQDGVCRDNKSLYRLDEGQRLQPCKSQLCKDKLAEINNHRHAFEMTGLYYLLN